MAGTVHYAVFLAAASLLAVTPGPGIFYVAARSISGGRSEGVASSCGTGLGGMIHVFAGSLGVSAIVLASAELFTLMKLLGAAYLIWMGVRAVQAARRDASAALEGGPVTPAIGMRKSFRDGVFVEALNPKTAAFFLAFIPQFVDAGSGRVALQFALLGSISVALNTLADVVVALAASAVRAGAAARPGLMHRLRAASGAGMIALGVGLVLTRRPAN